MSKRKKEDDISDPLWSKDLFPLNEPHNDKIQYFKYFLEDCMENIIKALQNHHCEEIDKWLLLLACRLKTIDSEYYKKDKYKEWVEFLHSEPKHFNIDSFEKFEIKKEIISKVLRWIEIFIPLGIMVSLGKNVIFKLEDLKNPLDLKNPPDFAINCMKTILNDPFLNHFNDIGNICRKIGNMIDLTINEL